ncbi:adenylyltransferase/cytidyltransferase family protein [Pseudonocardia sp. KRD291]|uniref:adenylyltransferase/cytidyltransferase family protein n=1 Tax=Pseudonocardia sp. KRD291 TaxID=2792007 RepID=UPI001C4A67FA|nr:adenylyltransferase/cytidyltransferase family protein [Pseudonocardia sp. KRD291]MBW0106069.1 adenylyltransferase/cytidyltransferase family protein [Pseudonocardia sp. KRD291]
MTPAVAELGCVTGRFQPVHGQHLELVELALQRCAHVLVAVTNPDTGARHTEPTSAHRHTGAANPFTYVERVWLLDAALRGAGLAEATTVVPFDLTRPQVWAEYVPLRARQFVRVYSDWEREKADRLGAGGYPLTVLDGDPAAKVDATDIRAALTSGAGWEDLVPPAVVPVLRDLLYRVPMGERSAPVRR